MAIDAPPNRKQVPAAIGRANRRLGEDVAAWRKLKGLTQVQLADRSGIGPATLARLERGEGGVSVENLLRVLRALGILSNVLKALDPYETDIGRLRSDQELPKRVRPRGLTREEDG
jgi:transcriptional regulator with XRE-family HTH domain